MTIGEAFRRLRLSLHLNQKQMADSVDIPLKSYQAYEYDKSAPSSKVIIRMADAYNVSTDYLLGRSDMPQPTNFDEREVKAAFAFRDAWQQANGAWQKAMQMLPTPNNVAKQVPAQ